MGQRDRFDGQFGAVLAAAHDGAPWALERMFTALAPAVTGYLRAQGSAEPEDLTSEVFVAILRNLRNFQGDEAGSGHGCSRSPIAGYWTSADGGGGDRCPSR